MGQVEAYLDELCRRAQTAVVTVGVYVGGSYALGAYAPGHSDLDVTAVTRGPLTRGEKGELVDLLRHDALPCPARRLELVVYSATEAASTGIAPAFQLNLNTGARGAFRVDFEPGEVEGFWFPIDRAVLREHAIALSGPPPRAVFGAIPRRRLLGVIAEALRWHLVGDASTADAVLNACRALRFAVSDEWVSKTAAGWWALDYVADLEVVRAALEARVGAKPPDRAKTHAFTASVLEEIELLGALRGGPLPSAHV